MFRFVKVSPSIIATDYNDENILNDNLNKLQNSMAKFIHLDVMDGRFVKNKTFGHEFIDKIKHKTDLLLDVHLMVENPDEVILDYINAGADILTVHFEACKDVEKVLKTIRDNGCLAGLAISPKTEVAEIEHLIVNDLADIVLVMGVEPGAYGQAFLPETALKVSEIRDINKFIEIEVDGGINIRNASMLRKLGANILVSGATVFNSQDINFTIKQLIGKE